MHWSRREHPWEHFIVRSVIPEDLFKTLQERVASWPKTPPDKRRISMFISDKEHEGYIFDPWVYNLLKKRFELVIDGIDWNYYTAIFEYNSCPAGYEYPIHADAPEKIVSLVIYVSENGDGTKLYKHDKEYYCQLDWVPNEGFYFYRQDDSWHSYESTVNHRDTINCILVKKDKEALRNLRYDLDV